MMILKYRETIDYEGRHVLKMNNIPEKSCCFDCVYCPEGRTIHHEVAQHDFGHHSEELLQEIREIITKVRPEIVQIEPSGEAFFDKDISFIIDTIHSCGCPVHILSAGYLLNRPPFRDIANKCEEIMGELRLTKDELLRKYQRPLPGIHLDDYIENLIAFRKQYKGRFFIEIALFRGLNDSDEELEKLRQILGRIRPDYVEVIDFKNPEKIHLAFGVGEERLTYARQYLQVGNW